MVARLYAYGRLNQGKPNGSTAGVQFEVKVLALVKSLAEALEECDENRLDQPVQVTARGRPGSGLEQGDPDPVISTDTAFGLIAKMAASQQRTVPPD